MARGKLAELTGLGVGIPESQIGESLIDSTGRAFNLDGGICAQDYGKGY